MASRLLLRPRGAGGRGTVGNPAGAELLGFPLPGGEHRALRL